MLARSRLPLSALLALMLSLSPSLSWYAYADQFSNSQGVNDAVSQLAEESPDGGGDGAGVAGEFNSGQPDSSGEDGSAAGEGLAGDFETSEEAGQDTSEADGGIVPSSSYDGDIEPLAVIGGTVIDALVVSKISGAWNSFSNGSVSWTTNPGTLLWLLSFFFNSFSAKADSANNYLKAIDTSTKNLNSVYTSQIGGYYPSTLIYYIWDRIGSVKTNTDGILSSLRQQWGYNYGTSNTVVFSSNSPAGWLKAINDRLNSKIDDGYFTTWVYYIYDNGLKIRAQNDRLYEFLHSQYDGRYFTTTIGYIYNALVTNGSLTSKGFSDVLSFLSSKIDDGYFTTWIYYIYDNGLKIRAQNDRLYEFLHSQYDGRYFTTTIGYIYDALVSNGALLENSNNLSYGVVKNLQTVDSSIARLQDSVTSWHENWNDFFTFVVEWAKSWDVLVKGPSWSDSDKLSLFAKLDGISNRLSVMAAKDVLDTLVGDLDFTRLAALSAEVEGAISSAFPFCIPAVLKQVLGLVAADPAPPCWEFDIAGEPLLCDFAPFQPVADVTGWVARICFLFALLVNTRRFVYMGGGAE